LPPLGLLGCARTSHLAYGLEDENFWFLPPQCGNLSAFAPQYSYLLFRTIKFVPFSKHILLLI
jgi:hypothetical protein